jgi:tRNA dimethylallyltransferase
MPFTQKLTEFNCLVVLGVTASGKTNLACQMAHKLNGAIISADSRQVYKHLTIGTGKDLNSYCIEGSLIPYYGIDIAEPSDQYYLHQFCELLNSSFNIITKQKILPIICGGTGLYLDALSKSFEYTQIKENSQLRLTLDGKTKEELLIVLGTFNESDTQHVDKSSIKRIIRGIEVADYLKSNQIVKHQLPYKPLYIGIQTELNDSIKQINKRLHDRLNNGLIEEVEGLIKMGITYERLINLGLEYKYISHYLQKKLTYSEFKEQLALAIIQYSKRQSTWFKKMEKEGTHINWFKQSELSESNINEIINTIKKAKSMY